MAARVTDFEFLDIEGLAYYRFRWVGNTVEWQAALARVKSEIDAEDRGYDELTKLWTISASYHNRLADIFPGFAGMVEVRRGQLSLF